jgi:hypothetical protein
VANDFRATGLFPCYDNIFRPHDFPLASEETDAAPVSHSALVNTSDQPSLSSLFFTFNFCGCSRSIRYQPCAKPEHTPKYSYWNSKENIEFITENMLWQLRKRKSNSPLNPKPVGLRRMLFLVLQTDRREGLPGSNSV